jgi:hypothetical protein
MAYKGADMPGAGHRILKVIPPGGHCITADHMNNTRKYLT